MSWVRLPSPAPNCGSPGREAGVSLIENGRMRRKLIKSLLALVLTLLALEGIIRATDRDYRLLGDPFKGPNTMLNYLAVDTYLQWRGRVGTPLMQPGQVINSRGLRSPEIPREKPSGVVRIAVLGDSCTFGFVSLGNLRFDTPRPYPELLEDLLNRKFRPGRFLVIKYGMIGYTSYHGLRMLRREVLPDDPDIVVIRFGWNDLLGSTTGRSLTTTHDPWLESIESFVSRSRLVALLLYRGSPFDPKAHIDWTISAQPVPSVTPEGYAWNLGRMIDLIRENGAWPILLDAPAAPITPEIRENKAFIPATRFDTLGHYLAAHDRYQVITERVAADKDVRFLRTAPPPEEARKFFSAYDVPHPTAAGHERIARILHAEIAREIARENRQ